MAPTWVKTQDDPWATPAPLLDVGEGISITPRATVAFGGLEVMGARVYDPATGSFLSVDPLLAPPEAAWASNPYSYAGNDPVGFSDPTGLAPVSDAQLAAYNQAHSGAISQAWNAASSWVKDNWQYIAAAAVVAVGVGLCITGVGSGLGATILIGAATSGVFSAGTQYITTGKIDPKSLAADIAIGGATAPIGGGVESAVGSALSRTGLCQAGRNILTGAASSAVEGGVSDGLSYLAGPGPHTVGGLASSVGGGAAGGGLTGGATAKITNHMQGLTGWACFTADTPVVMADGSTRPIAQVEVGDRVLAHNPHTGADEAREVLDTPVHEDAVTWRVSTDDGGTVTTTPTHRFWVQGAGWTKAQDLVPGDRLRTTAGPGAPPSTTENPHTTDPADGATGRAGDDPHANADGADGAVVVESVPTGRTATVHNLTIHGLTNYYIITTTGTRALVHNEYGTQVPYGSTELSRKVQEARLAAGDRGHNYAAALLEDGDTVIGVSKKRLHAEVDILENKANGRKVISLFTEFEPCGFKCGPKLDRSKITDVTWSFPWNPPEVRPASRAARDEAIRRLFE